MLTARDRELVEWVGRLGAVGAVDVMAHFGIGRTAAYRRLARCTAGGLLANVRVLHGEPGLYVATRRGLAWAGLHEFWVCRVGAASAMHWQTCARLAVWLERVEPGVVVRSERELRVAERRAGRPLASAIVGGVLPGGRARLHRPDLLLLSAGAGPPLVVEVELSVKGAARLDAICRGWARCEGISGVRYYATAAVARAVERAVSRVLATDVIEVRPLPVGVHTGGGRHADAFDVAA